ncbi:MAG: hypothetical protein ACK4RN_01175 [Pseudorhodobacter sp.]
MAEIPPLNKIDAIERQLEAAVFLMLKNFSPEAVHTLVSAALGLLSGLSKHETNSFLESLEQKLYSRILSGNEKLWRFYQNRGANFLKHADRDPTGVCQSSCRLVSF